MKIIQIISFIVLFIVQAAISHASIFSVGQTSYRSMTIDTNTVTVNITALPSNDTLAYNVVEIFPEGITPTAISHDGAFSTTDGTIKWGTFLDNTQRDLSYRFKVNPGTYLLDSKISFDGNLSSITEDQEVTVDYYPLNIDMHNIPPAQVDHQYTVQLTVSGGYLPYAFGLAYGSLPDGISLNPDTGEIAGTPLVSGSYTFSVSVTDQQTNYAEREFSLEINETFQFIDNMSQLPRGTRQLFYFYNIEASGGKPPYTFEKISGNIPQGLQFNSDGNISGIPDVTGTFTFSVQVTDSYDRVISKEFSLHLVENIHITTNQLPDGIAGTPYEKQLTYSGGYGDTQWSVYSGTLPQGLQLDESTGHITGTSKSASYHSIVLSIKDIDGRTAYKDMTFEMVGMLELISQTMPTGLNNSFYSEAIRMTGGKAPFIFTYTGQLPAGLVLDEKTGIISGSPEGAGYNNILIQITDNTQPQPQTLSKTIGIRTTSRLTITTPAILPHVRKGKAINAFNLHAGGGPSPYQWQIASGHLPYGLQLNPETGLITGTPVDSGNMVITVQVNDQNNQTAQKEFIWHIYDALSIQTQFLPDAAKDIVYNVTLYGKGGLPDYTWTLKNGQLPDGLQLDLQAGRIYGTPTRRSPFTFSIQISDTDSPPQVAEKTFTMEVLDDDLYIYTPDLPTARMNQAYSALIEAKLGIPPYQWHLSSGVLPDGLTISATQNMLYISGTPTTTDNFSFDIQVTDSSQPGREVFKSYTIQVVDSVRIETTSLPYAAPGENYLSAIKVFDGLPPYTWAVIGGQLPEDLVLDAQTGQISGIINMQTGTSQEFTIRATDSAEPESLAEKQLAIYVFEKSINIQPDKLPGAFQRQFFETDLQIDGGIGPFYWSVSYGELPGWLRIDPDTGTICGKPIQCGYYDFSIKVVDSGTPVNMGIKSYRLEIQCDNTPVIVDDLDASGVIDLPDIIIALQILAGIPAVDYFLSGSEDVVNMDVVLRMFAYYLEN
jgi:hypothetical protein